MPEAIVCLDSGVWIKFLVVEEPANLSDAASRLVRHALGGARIVAPAFAWAEIGSVLRKKVRQSCLQPEQAEDLWSKFLRLPIDYPEGAEIRRRAWEIAQAHSLPTLYDAAFLACTEVVGAPDGTTREFWTSDEELLRALGGRRPRYVRRLVPDLNL